MLLDRMRVQAIFPASHRRIVRVQTPKIEAAIPILTHDDMMTVFTQSRPKHHDIIHDVSTFV